MILEKLRLQTQDTHKKLEESSLMSPITSKSITKEQYIHILRKFYGFFHPIEHAINAHKEVSLFLDDYDQRRKSDYLIKDLKIFSRTENLSCCSNIPEVKSLASAFGCLYVMEGSTLGGRMISKILHEMLGIGPDSGASFFNGYGAETGMRWKKFQEALLAVAEHARGEEQIINSANQTFLGFYNWVNLN